MGLGWNTLVELVNLMSIYHYDKCHYFDENGSFCWKLWSVIKYIPLMKINHLDEKSLCCQIHHFDKNEQFGELIALMKIHYFDEKSSLWCIFFNLLKIHHNSSSYFDENSIFYRKFNTLMKIFHINKSFSFWWKFITSMRIFMAMKNHLFDGKSSLW